MEKTHIFDDMDSKGFVYKNFKMGLELGIAGEFIYNGTRFIQNSDILSNDAITFFGLYNLSVGIERLQKVAYVLWEKDSIEEHNKFVEKIKTHNHMSLYTRINDKLKQKGRKKLELGYKERNFLKLLDDFYKNARYNRFNLEGEFYKEVNILGDYIKKYIEKYIEEDFEKDMEKDITHLLDPNSVRITRKIRKLLMRTIRNICSSYYNLIVEWSRVNNTYTDELEYGSNAFKIFYLNNDKDSFVHKGEMEKIAIKELFIFLKNYKERNSFFKVIEGIEPLELDPGLIPEYIDYLSKGIISTDLVECVEECYENMEYPIERKEYLEIIFESMFDFDGTIMLEANRIMETMLNNREITKQILELKDIKDCISEDSWKLIIENFIKECAVYLDSKDEIRFKEQASKLLNECENIFKEDVQIEFSF